MFLYRLMPLFVSAAVLTFIVTTVEPPVTLAAASPSQLILLFLPLLLTIACLLNLYCQNFRRSLPAAGGVVLLLILKSLGTINTWTIALTALSIVTIFPAVKRPKKEIMPKTRPFSRLKKQNSLL